MKKCTKDMFGNEVKEGDLVKMYDAHLDTYIGEVILKHGFWYVIVDDKERPYDPVLWFKLEPDPNLKPYIVWAAAIIVFIILLVSFAV
jgi:hypothetical protein